MPINISKEDLKANLSSVHAHVSTALFYSTAMLSPTFYHVTVKCFGGEQLLAALSI